MLLVFCFWFFYLRTAGEKKLFREGNDIVNRIEDFKKEHHRLPYSLTEIGIKVIDEANPELHYDMRDSIHYTVFFGTSLGESEYYYSDSKKWEDRYRDMK